MPAPVDPREVERDNVRVETVRRGGTTDDPLTRVLARWRASVGAGASR